MVGLVLGIGLWGASRVRELSEQMADPEQRRAKVLEVLGASEIPDGYYPLIGVSVPFVFDLAILSGELPAEASVESESLKLGERGFLYVRFPSFAGEDPKFRDFLEGASDDPRVLRDTNVDVDLEERVSQGVLSRDGDEIVWACHRGSVDTDEAGSSPRGLVNLMLIDCDSDTRRRIGIWFGPDPAPETPAEELDVSETVGDGTALDRFLRPIRPCS